EFPAAIRAAPLKLGTKHHEQQPKSRRTDDMPIRPRKITGSRCASRDDGFGKGDSSPRLAAETKLCPPPCLAPESKASKHSGRVPATGRNLKAESRWRPGARRAAIPLPPPPGATRARTPCRRLRTSLLGLYVRFNSAAPPTIKITSDAPAVPAKRPDSDRV